MKKREPGTEPMTPTGSNEPVFGAPWHAQIFAMTVKLSESGAFTWKEWTACLGKHIERSGGSDTEAYYLAWLAALEEIICGKAILDAGELSLRKDAWARAAANTPHGEPIVLD